MLHMRVSNLQQEELSLVCWLPFICSQLFTFVIAHPSITYIKKMKTLKLLSVEMVELY